MADLPSKIMVWESSPDLRHIGTWATTRYPVDAVAYVPKADAEAAVALVVEKAAERLDANRAQLNFAAMLGLLRDEPLPEQIVSALSDWLDVIADAIRAIAPASGVAKLAELRAERDVLKADRDSAARMWQASEQEREAAVDRAREASQMLAIETNHAAQAEAERDTLAAGVARLRDRERVLVGMCRKVLGRPDMPETWFNDLDAATSHNGDKAANWKDICREANAPDVCEEPCSRCAALATDADAALSAAQPAGMAGKGE